MTDPAQDAPRADAATGPHGTDARPPAVDWAAAVATGTRLAPRPPRVGAGEAREAVAELREGAARARALVHRVTGLDAPAPAGGSVLVLDRPGWIKANAAAFETLMDPLVRRLEARRPDRAAPPAVRAAGAKVAGAEAGALLAFLSSKVLGQYELTPPGPPGTPGRLLLVAPNVVEVERELDLVPSDFRLWVCAHEETHRVQFGATPWLRQHLLDLVGELADAAELDPLALVRRAAAAAGSLRDAFSAEGGGDSLAEAFQTPRQREVTARITAVMSLLEGHADVVMDEVGPEEVPTVATIRERFQARRAAGGRFDVAVRRLLGLEAKGRQYADGARFVRVVTARVGTEGFNRVWESPGTLPTPDEVARPRRWVERVHG